VRQFSKFDPPLQHTLAIPHAAESLELDVTAFVRGGVGGVGSLGFGFVVSDPDNCRSKFASAHHPDASLRPALRIEWADPTLQCLVPQVP
jgi:hypothetical protein